MREPCQQNEAKSLFFLILRLTVAKRFATMRMSRTED
jgi:hypothetical protein